MEKDGALRLLLFTVCAILAIVIVKDPASDGRIHDRQEVNADNLLGIQINLDGTTPEEEDDAPSSNVRGSSHSGSNPSPKAPDFSYSSMFGGFEFVFTYQNFHAMENDDISE